MSPDDDDKFREQAKEALDAMKELVQAGSEKLGKTLGELQHSAAGQFGKLREAAAEKIEDLKESAPQKAAELTEAAGEKLDQAGQMLSAAGKMAVESKDFQMLKSPVAVGLATAAVGATAEAAFGPQLGHGVATMVTAVATGVLANPEARQALKEAPGRLADKIDDMLNMESPEFDLEEWQKAFEGIKFDPPIANTPTCEAPNAPSENETPKV
jgi:hypothetical protein